MLLQVVNFTGYRLIRRTLETIRKKAIFIWIHTKFLNRVYA